MNPTQRTYPISGSLIRARAGGLLSLLALSISANGATLRWVPAGAGDWDTTSLRWDIDGPGGLPPATWSQKDAAIFDGVLSGEVNVVSPIEASRVIFESDGYILSGGPLTMIEQNPGDFVDFVAQAGVTGTVNAEIVSPGDLWVNFFGETGTVVFGGDNSYAGKTSVRGGVLELGGTLGSTVIDVEKDATLRLSSAGRLDDSAVLTSGALAPGGTVELNGDETVSLFNSSGLLNGAGTLNAPTYNLSNGAETAAGANLGSGQLNSGPGEVTLNGDAATEDVNINSGNLNLNGELTGVTDLAVASGASLTLGGSERINNAAVLHNNDGTVTLNGAEEVTTFNSTGQLGGSGTLTAPDYNLSNGAETASGANLGSGQLNSGPGEVTLNGNAATEDVNINSGTLNLNGELTGATDLTISDGATLQSGSADRVADGATVNLENGGLWMLGGDDTVGVLNSSGLLNGTGTLTAGNYNLSNGAEVSTGTNLGSGQLNSGPGVVALNGDAAAEDVNVNSGTLNLNGELAGVIDLTISNGATLQSGSADRVADGATVNLENGGIWMLDGDDTVGVLNSSGLLNGTGTLTAENYNLSNGAEVSTGTNLGSGQLNSGPGVVALNGDAAAEDVNVNSGTLNLNGELAGVTDLTISDGATLQSGSADRVADGANVNLENGGLWMLGGDDTVGVLNSSGLLNGAGTLTAENYNLSNGAEVSTGTNLGSGQLNSGPGVVALNGDAAAEDVNVNSGTLNLNGELTGVTDLDISSGAAVNLGSAERIDDEATVNNNGGNLSLNGAEIVGEYNSAGQLTGTGTLMASQYNLSDGAETAAGANLGSGQLNSGPGEVTLNGNAATEDVNVNSGTLNLNGELAGVTDLTISDGATLQSGSADRVADGATVNLENGGLWMLGGDDTVGVLNSAGQLTGTGTLMASQYNLSDGAETAAGANLGSGQLNSGPGEVTLNGNAATEDVNVNSGTLNLNGELAGVTDLTISNGATLQSGSADRVADGATVNLGNGSLWMLGGSETVGVLNSSGLLNGAGTLTAENYNLSNGAEVSTGTNLGSGQLNSGPGVVALNGDAAAEDVNVNSGTLNLNGELTGVTDLDISSGAAVNLGSAERIDDEATVNNNGGNFSLNGAEIVGKYNSAGQLTGTGTLTASQYNLSDGAETAAGANLGSGQLNSGPGEVALNGDAAAEDVNVNSGTLNLNGELAGVIDLTISNGATLQSGSADRVADGANVNLENGGIWMLGGDDTVGVLNSSGLLNGAGTLTAGNYNLSNGAEVSTGTNLGSGQLNSGPGEVALNGDAAAEDVNVNSGTLNLNGELAGVTDLTISNGATLQSGSADRVADGATVNLENGGLWMLGGSETVDQFNSSGLLNGGSTLTAAQYDLSDGAEVPAGTNLGGGQLVSSSGSVDLSGDAAAEDVDVTGGTLDLKGQLTGVTDLTISNGATLQSGSADRVADGATVNLENGGIWMLDGDDAVGVLNSSGLLNGAGTLNAPTYNLSNGAETAAGANLGSGQLNSGPGEVTLNGNAATEDVNINSGNLNLNGELTGVTDLAVASGASLTLGGSERINNAAVLHNNDGTVTLNGAEEVTTFNSTGQLGGSGTLTAPDYNLSNGAETASGANLGSGQLNSGPGEVTLNGNAATEDVNINSGTLNLNGELTGATDLTISDGATLQSGSADRVADGATVNLENGGLWMLGGDDTVGVLNSSGLLNGAGTLIASQYNLSNGAETASGANLGSGQLNSGPGEVTLNGNAATEDVNINSGNLNLNGELTGVTDLAVASGASLTLGGSERINNAAVLHNNDGTVTLNGAEEVTTFNSTGQLDGTGTLTAGNYNLSDGASTAVGADLGSGKISSGPGIVTLNGDAVAEDVDLNSGALNLNGALTNVTDLTVSPGAALILGGAERINDGAVLNNNDGSVSLSGAEEITTFNSTGILDGPGTLTAANYNLSNGAITAVGANLGAGQLSSGPGVVTLNGDAAAENVNVNNGTLNLNGELTGVTDLDISSGATVNLGSAERIDDEATVNNNGGNLSLNGAEIVGEYNSAGQLTGTGTLMASQYNLSNGAETASGANLGSGQLNSGPGEVTLNGNAATEDVNVNSGTLNLNGELAGVTDLTISDGATLQSGSADRVADGATVNLGNGGLWMLGGDDTVGVLNSSGLLNGAGTLTAENYNLSNGAEVSTGANLGSGQLNSGPGVVALNGDAAAEDVNVNSGTLNLNGELTGVTDLDISSGAAVNLGSAERIDDEATVNNNGGNLSLNGAEIVGEYNSAGQLTGTGTLIASQYNLSNGAETASGANLGSGQLNSGPGEVTLNGNAATEDVNINSGNLNLNGELTGVTDLAVASGASLTLGGSERINNAAVLHNNDGTVTLNGAEEVTTFNSTGQLDGTGTLTAGNYNLSDGASTAVGADLGSGKISSGPGIVTLNGDAVAEDVDLNSGALNLNGALTNVTDLTVSPGAALILGGAERINDGAVLNNNDGSVSLSGAEEITTFNSTGILDGPGTLTAANYNLSNGAITAVGANLGAGQLSSGPGVVTLNGDAAAEDVDVNSGELNLNGSLTGATDVTVLGGAILRSTSVDRINNAATVNLASGANWILGGDEGITSFVSSGLLNGSGLLTAAQYDLSNGAVTAVGADLGTGLLNSGPGAVILNGNINADFTNVNSGTLTTEGEVQNPGGVITVGAGATWFVNGLYSYDSLRGNGTVDSGGVNGNTFTNSTNLRPGTSIGTLAVVGDYVESGTFHGELDPTSLGDPYLLSDTLATSGTTTLTASSVLRPTAINGLTPGGILIGHRFNIISATGGIVDGWSEITDGNNAGPGGSSVASQFLFNTATGDLLGLGLAGSQTPADYAGINTNQLAIINAVTNGANDAVGNYSSTDGAEGTVLDAVYASGTAGNVDARLDALDTLSPEGYGGAIDYTLHATRVYAQTVRKAAPLVGDSKYALVAGYNHFSTGSSSSNNSNDYDLGSNGGYVGVRVRNDKEFTLGGFLSFDSGEVDSGRTNLDVSGYAFGGFVEYTPADGDALSYWGSMSYGSYEFDGRRNGLVSRLSTPSFDGSAFQIGLGVDYLSYEKDGLRVIPGGSLNFISSSVDGFTETGGADALRVDDQDSDALYLDLALRLEYKLPDAPVTLHGELGWQHDFNDADRDVSAILGSSSFRVNAPGLGSDAVILGLGAYYDLSEQYQINLSYRGEFRGDSDAHSGLNLGIKGSF